MASGSMATRKTNPNQTNPMKTKANIDQLAQRMRQDIESICKGKSCYDILGILKTNMLVMARAIEEEMTGRVDFNGGSYGSSRKTRPSKAIGEMFSDILDKDSRWEFTHE